MSLTYSVGMYLYRSNSIRQRRNIKYYDAWGPSILCFSLFAAVVVNAGFQLSSRRSE